MRTLTIILALAISANLWASNFTQIKSEESSSSLFREIGPTVVKLQREALDFNGYWDETTFGIFKVSVKKGQSDDKTVRQLFWKTFLQQGVESVDGKEVNPETIDHRFVYDAFLNDFADEMTEEFMSELDGVSDLVLKLARKHQHIKLYAVGYYGSYYSGSFGQGGMAIYNTRSQEIMIVTLGASE